MDAARPRGGDAGPEDGTPLTASAGAGSAPAPWSLRGVVITALAALVAAIALSALAVVFLGIARRPAAELPAQDVFALAVVSDGALLIVLFVLGRRLLDLRPADLGFRRPTREALRLAAAAAGVLWVAAIAVNTLQTVYFGDNPQPLVVAMSAHSGPLAFVLDLATGTVIAPFAEETLFRGFIFGGLAQRRPFWAAASISALLFALFHGAGVLLPIFVLGLGLAYVYARTRTIWASMATHALVNAISLALVFIAPR